MTSPTTHATARETHGAHRAGQALNPAKDRPTLSHCDGGRPLSPASPSHGRQ